MTALKSEAVRESRGARVRKGIGATCVRVGGALVAGVVITIGVAWVGVLWSPKVSVGLAGQYGPKPHRVEVDSNAYRASDWVQAGIRQERWCQYSEWNPDGRIDTRQPEFTSFIHEVRSGWPFRSFGVVARVEESRDSDLISSYARGHNGWDTTRIQRLFGTNIKSAMIASALAPILPVAPVWPGFAFDCAFWAGVLGAVCFGPAMLRSALRRHHGLCVKCAYDVRGVSTCPECGTPVARVDAALRAHSQTHAGGAA